MNASTRVLLQEIPAMLRAIIQEVIASQPDIELLPEIPRVGAVTAWRRAEPDVVVVATTDINDVSVADCLNRWPRARLLVIELSGRETVLHELLPHATLLGALSPDQLVATIRQGRNEQRP